MPLEKNTELPKDLKLTKEFFEAFKVMNETSKNRFTFKLYLPELIRFSVSIF